MVYKHSSTCFQCLCNENPPVEMLEPTVNQSYNATDIRTVPEPVCCLATSYSSYRKDPRVQKKTLCECVLDLGLWVFTYSMYSTSDQCPPHPLTLNWCSLSLVDLVWVEQNPDPRLGRSRTHPQLHLPLSETLLIVFQTDVLFEAEFFSENEIL